MIRPNREGELDGFPPRGGSYPEGFGDTVACALHRSVQTRLRCVRCGVPVCPKCVEHSAQGGLCPRCARRLQPRSGRAEGWSALRSLVGLAAGIGLGVVGGALLALFPFGALLIVPFLLLGLLTGEAVAIAAGRGGGAFLALLGLFCGLLGPIVGRTVAATLIGPELGLGGGPERLNALQLLLIVVAALIAGVRAGSSR